MKTGTIKFLNITKGYGFIVDDETGQEIFLHVTGIPAKDKKPFTQANQAVTYDETQGKKGLQATNVQLA